MSKIITAEELLTKVDEFERLETGNQEEVCIKAMIEFAKLHVQKALKQAYDNIEYTSKDSSEPYVVEDSILNAYSLENIK